MITKIKKKFKNMLKNIPGGNFLDGANFLEEESGRFTWEPGGEFDSWEYSKFSGWKII